jgi:dipeptidyl aminopeptidase/acylaminoacyl peptidase
VFQARAAVGITAAIILTFTLGTAIAAATAAPEVFAPGIISGPEHDSAPAFTPDGRTVYFSRSDGDRSTLLVSHLRRARWTEPQTAEFSGTWSDMEPAMSPDGRFIVFVSNRPVEEGSKPLDGYFNGKAYPARGGNLWRVNAQGSGWSQPVRLPDTVNNSTSTFAPAVAADGSLYFMHPAADSKRFQLFRAQLERGIYREPQALSFSDGSTTDVDPAVAPDESFMVFGSGRTPAKSMDLFIVFRKNAVWGTPVHLGDIVNSPGSDAEARLSADHKTLYFSSERLANGDPSQPRPPWDNGKYNIWHVSLTAWLKQPSDLRSR